MQALHCKSEERKFQNSTKRIQIITPQESQSSVIWEFQRKDKVRGLQLHCYAITYILAKQYCEKSVKFMVTSLPGHDDNNNPIVSFLEVGTSF